MVGLPEAEILSRGVAHRLVAAEADAAERRLKEAFAQGERVSIELSILNRNDQPRRLLLSGRPVPIGGVDGYVMTAVDRTVLIEADEKSARFAAALENTRDLTVIFDEAGRISHANATFIDLFTPGGSPVGLDILDVAGQEFWDHLSVDRPSVIGGDDELSIRAADGRRVALSLLVTRSTEVVTGRPIFTAVARDVTDLVRARDELAHLVEAKDRFIASVSHELRTPLTAVVGLASELASALGDFSQEDIIDFVGLIAQQSGAVAMLVEDLLTMARADAGTLSIAPQAIQLADQAARALDTVPQSVSDGVVVEGAAPAVWADPMRVRQILRNLLLNAKQYGGETRKILLSMDAGVVRLSVADDGQPLSESQRRFIFSPYERAHDRLGTPDSLGLGLTVSRRLARLMDGEVTYDHIDGWSMFSLELPMASDDRNLAAFTDDPDRLMEDLGLATLSESN